MENKHNFMGIIISVVVAVILLTVLPIINSMNVECPPCENIPTLYTPTISISDDTLTITPNSNNGTFVTGYKIYVDEVLLDTTTSTTYDLSEELTEIGTYEIYVTAYATGFTDSEPSNIEEYVVEPIPMGPKVFEVGDVLPATTKLRIYWIDSIVNIPYSSPIKTGIDGSYTLIIRDYFSDYDTNSIVIYHLLNNTYYIEIYNDDEGFMSPYTDFDGDEPYVEINTSTWDINFRTIFSIGTGMDIFAWEDLNA